MINVRSLLFAFAICGLTIGCAAPPLSRAQVDQIRPGEKRESIMALLGKPEPKVSHTFEASGVKYLAEHYSLQTGTTQSSTVVCTPLCIYIPITVPVFTPFVIVYKDADKTVLGLGTIEQLSKSEKPEVSELMPILKKSYDASLESKKKA